MKQAYAAQLRAYTPNDAQEAADQQALLWYLDRFGDGILLRENPVAHVTSSGFVMNPSLDKALMVHHNIRATWAWTGGHADGDADLLAVALREAMEETGAPGVRPLSPAIASIDVLPSYRHVRRGEHVSTHLHLSVAFILVCDEDAPLRVKPDENTAVRWFPVEAIAAPTFLADDVLLYGKLVQWAQKTADWHAGGS